MRTLNVSISDTEFINLGLQQEELSFADLLTLIRRQLMRDNQNKSVELAEKNGLYATPMNEITEELKEVRKNATLRH